MSLVKVLAGLSRLSRPPAGFRWSHLPLRQARAPRPLPRRVLMTQPRSTPPYSADVSLAKTEFRRAGLEPALTHLPPERP